MEPEGAMGPNWKWQGQGRPPCCVCARALRWCNVNPACGRCFAAAKAAEEAAPAAKPPASTGSCEPEGAQKKRKKDKVAKQDQ